MRYRRRFVPGDCYFFTVVTHERRPILKEVSAFQTIMEAFSHIQNRHPFELDAYVVMPDHIHCIWTLPPGDSNYPTRWRLIKSRFTKRCDPKFKIVPDAARIKKHEQAVWQHRYWEHLIRDEWEYRRILDYIHANPVKHGFTTKPVDWPYSSIHRYIADGTYPPDWGNADT